MSCSIYIHVKIYFHSVEKVQSSARNTKSRDNKRPYNLERLDTALDPDKEEKRKIEKAKALNSYIE